MATLVLLGLTVIGFLVLLDRKDKRTADTMGTTLNAHRLELLGVLERAERERDTHRREVEGLLQRVQAPQLAVIEHAQAQVAPDDDGLPLTDEQIAAEQQRVAAIKVIEDAEREFAGRML